MMELTNIPEAFQTKLRLMIISALITGAKSFNELKTITGASDGNISVQISKLEEWGYLTVTKSIVFKKTHTELTLTEFGKNSFKEYIALLNKIVSEEKNL